MHAWTSCVHSWVCWMRRKSGQPITSHSARGKPTAAAAVAAVAAAVAAAAVELAVLVREKAAAASRAKSGPSRGCVCYKTDPMDHRLASVAVCTAKLTVRRVWDAQCGLWAPSSNSQTDM